MHFHLNYGTKNPDNLKGNWFVLIKNFALKKCKVEL